VLQYCVSAAPVPYPAPYYFSAQSPTTRWLADVPAYWMVKNNLKSIGCLASSDATGQLINNVAGKAVRAAGLSYTSQTFNISDQDVTTQLTKLRSAGVDSIYACTTGPGVVTTLRGMQQLGMNLPVWVGAGSASLAIADLIKGILPQKGAFTAGAKVQVYTKLSKSDRHYKSIVAFANAYEKRFNQPADIFAASASDMFTILTTAIAAAGPQADNDAVVKYMEDRIRFTGVHLSYNFNAGDHRGTDLDGIVERYTDKGTFDLVAQYKPSQIPKYSNR
jgi:ABC-type branched-subunit amino acid transport system substrate-binding protein